MEEISWDKELEIARAYAEDGPNEFPENYLERCLTKAKEKADIEGIDISKQVKEIREIWDKQLD